MPRKKGFWIKKDGFIATDSSMNPIMQRREAKLKKRILDKGTLRPKSKGFLYLKNVYVPHLVQQISNHRCYAHVWRKHSNEVDARANKLVSEIKQMYKRKYTEFRKYHARLVKNRDKRKATAKPPLPPSLERYKTPSECAKYYGPFYYMMANKFCEEQKIKPKMLQMMVCISYYRVFKSIFLNHWGLVGKNVACDLTFKKLLREEYIHIIPKTRGSYVFTLKGNEFMRTFDEYYNNGRKNIDKALKHGAAKTKPKLLEVPFRVHRNDSKLTGRKPGRPRKV